MKDLKEILYNVPTQEVLGTLDGSINQIVFDSRIVSENDLFIAIRGLVSDGHQYIDKAISLGAKCIICEDFPQNIDQSIIYVKVSNTHETLALISSNYYENPSNNIELIGITGTNGKTTVASLLYQLFKNAGFKVGLISTVKIMVNDQEFPATHTTPDSLTINKYLSLMIDNGVDYCFMEVSSHGIHQKRTTGLNFRGGVFTNLSHDHLDYHATFAEYRDVKKSFFDHLPKTAFALSNIDDKNGQVMLQNTAAKKVTYALKTYADFRAQILENQLSGLLLKINDHEVWTQLIGQFNAYNLLAIYAVAVELGLEELEVLRLLSELESVSGRFQFIISKDNITAIVDYAHTPDALENVLNTINDIRTKNEQLITVFGCGGDRDQSKRPVMGDIASVKSDKIIITSDNPRSEDPDDIIQQIENGVQPIHYKKSFAISDRRQAIKAACQIANSGDIILIAGKGHETYQEVKGVKTHFDDMEEVKSILNQLNK